MNDKKKKRKHTLKKVIYLVYCLTIYLCEVHQIIKSFQHLILKYHHLYLVQMVMDEECVLCIKEKKNFMIDHIYIEKYFYLIYLINVYACKYMSNIPLDHS